MTIFVFFYKIDWYPATIALNPEPHTWLIKYTVVSFGIPAFIAACRAGFCPQPEFNTWPK